ncbi:12-oxophytodienoate reductase [Marivibrio halodurans]|uniref:12-oxophytodienoate reductase n=1 Tax=Marivibrio halodurans TaxID=2039722 RepID=A0A8J7S4H9_9PROT|nr:12-oxophytodienoate reductase [Marivibrio halodurans]MBP5858403.1 12-oxophytodienoate reductase [Marivibrio halodurans]
MAELFDPFTLNAMHLKNRVVMAPMTRGLSPEWLPTSESVAYYRARAEGGAGLIISEGVAPDLGSSHGERDVPVVLGERAVDAWRAVTDAVHQAGAAMACQLWHVGAFRRIGIGPTPDAPVLSPSGVPVWPEVTPDVMSDNDIADAIEAFAKSSRAAVSAGFDAVEVHGAHGYLIDQFLWSQTNRRSDRYGGGPRERGRFAADVVRAVRREVGPDIPILFRFSQWKRHDFEAWNADSPDMLGALLEPVSEAGVDLFHASTRRYWEPAFPDAGPEGLAAWTRRLTGKPTIAVGSIGLDDVSRQNANPVDLNDLQDRLAAGEFDLAALGRQLLADPEWPNKVAAGRLSDVKPFRRAHIDWRDSP